MTDPMAIAGQDQDIQHQPKMPPIPTLYELSKWAEGISKLHELKLMSDNDFTIANDLVKDYSMLTLKVQVDAYNMQVYFVDAHQKKIDAMRKVKEVQEKQDKADAPAKSAAAAKFLGPSKEKKA